MTTTKKTTCPDCGAVTEWQLIGGFTDPRTIIDEAQGPQWFAVGGELCDCAVNRHVAEEEARTAARKAAYAAELAEQERIAAYAKTYAEWDDERKVDCSPVWRAGANFGAIDTVATMVNVAGSENLPRVRLLNDGFGILWMAGTERESKLLFTGAI